MNMNFVRFRRFSLIPLTLTLLFARIAFAQTALLPSPFSSVLAGEAAGSGNTVCTTGIPNSSGQNQGDGCLPTQAVIANMYDVITDPEGNVYISEQNTTLPNGAQSGSDIRVIYKGGVALTAALIAANPQIQNFTPVSGRIYTLVGALTAAISSHLGLYHCGNDNTSQLLAFDSLGNGCPAGLTRVSAKGLAVDRDGNLLFANTSTKYGLRVVYVGGARMANLITLLNPNVSAPQVGYVYQLGFQGAQGGEGDGLLASNAGAVNPRYVAVDQDENIYMSDGTTGSGNVYDGAQNVRMINGTTGIITTVAGETTCGLGKYGNSTGCPGGYAGDGGPATSALFDYPATIFLDQYNNLFITDEANGRLRVLYRGGTLAGISNPVVGYIYTYAGGDATSGVQGTLATDATPAQQLKLTFGAATIDAAGYIYIADTSTHDLWRIDPTSGVANVIAGGITTASSATAGNYCNKGTSGPKSTDNFGDGCPGLQTALQAGVLGTDQFGNLYNAFTGTSSTGAAYLVQKFSYNNQIPATPVGSSVTVPIAFTATVATSLVGRTFSLEGQSSGEYSDAGGTTCTTTIALAAKSTCVINVKFTPSRAGQRPGSIQLRTSSAVAGSELISGTGIASDIAIDNGTVSMLGSGLTPSGIAADVLGNVFVADSKGNQVLKGSATGTTLAPLVTGLSKPSAVALDGAGNLYIADTDNNRILVTNASGSTLASLGTNLSGPKGVLVDPYGNIFVSDTGNNRIVELSLNGNQLTVPFPAVSPALASPTQLAMDASGNFYVLDSGNNRIDEYLVASGTSAIVPLDAGVVPTAFAIDSAGDIYVTDATSLSVLDYYAGATPGYRLVVGFKSPVGLAIDADANLFVADSGLTAAVALRRSTGNIVLPQANVGSTTGAELTVSNVGNAPLTFSMPLAGISGSSAFTITPATTNGCGAGISYAAGSSCDFGVSFTPTASGTASGTSVFNTNASNTSAAVAQLIGTSTSLPANTQIALSVLPSSGVFYSLPVTLVAVLSATPLTTTPTGTLTLTIDGRTDLPPVAVGNGTVSFTVALPIGVHYLTVTYSGGAPYASSAAAITVPVKPAVTTTNLTVTPQYSNGVGSIVFASSVQAMTASGETGTLTIWAGPVGTGTPICSSAINAANNYSISCNSAMLNFASNAFTAVYSGSTDGNFAPSQSAVLAGGSGDFIAAPTSNSFTVPQGGVGLLSVNLVSLYGSSGTITPSCSGLPPNSVCRFNPVTANLSSNETPVSVTVQIYTNVPSTLASLEPIQKGRGLFMAFAGPLFITAFFLRRRSILRMVTLCALAFSISTGLSGCGSGNILQTFSTLTTPTGNFNLNLTFTGSNGESATHSVPVSFTVLQAP